MPNEHTITENLQRLVDAKTAIANAITAKGGTVAQGDGLEEFPADIASIQGGLEMNVKFTTGNKVIPDYMFYNNHGSGSTSSAYPIEEVVIGDGITRIGYSAFNGCTSLTSITIGDGVTYIDSYAFGSCSSLTNVTIGNGITDIYTNTFYNCGLKSITIPNNVTSIRYYAFQDCSSLTSVIIGNGVTSIASSAFKGCSNITTITIDKPRGSISGSPWGATNATIVWTG